MEFVDLIVYIDCFHQIWKFFFLPHWVACRILALQLKTEPRPSAVKVQSPNHCEFPLSLFLQMFFMPTIVSPLLLGLPLCICQYAWECTMNFWGSVYFFFFTFFSLTFPCLSHWIIFIDWSSCLPVFYNWNLLWSPSSKFSLSFFIISLLIFCISCNIIIILSFSFSEMVSFSSLTIFIIADLMSLCSKSNIWDCSVTMSMDYFFPV